MADPSPTTDSGETGAKRNWSNDVEHIDQEQEQQHRNNHMMAPFLSSMSFASGAIRSCDCDECFSGGTRGGPGVETIPRLIMEAIREHKRLKRQSMPFKRTQIRELVKRQGPISVYKMILPLDSDPLIEFGSSHRLVWVKSLPESTKLKSIGKGIIGSRNEERSREELPWTEEVYFVPSNGGKAVGFVLENHGETAIRTDNTNEDQGGDEQRPQPGSLLAILFICKIQPDDLSSEKYPKHSAINEETKDVNGETKQWFEVIQSVFEDRLCSLPEGGGEGGANPFYHNLPKNCSKIIKDTILELF